MGCFELAALLERRRGELLVRVGSAVRVEDYAFADQDLTAGLGDGGIGPSEAVCRLACRGQDAVSTVGAVETARDVLADADSWECDDLRNFPVVGPFSWTQLRYQLM
ncbi:MULTISPECIES: hypothetical protein [Micromonospora]|uniref:hypothetical protein n=1 Tax=Micromonospora TaxID=1873 RepID=UPI00248BE9F8|nr:hypothetical protein [Micromonospora sp. WMMC264]WBB88157.1 hypothetical protein O7542_13690 [Micromonospora sp. WMMC264]